MRSSNLADRLNALLRGPFGRAFRAGREAQLVVDDTGVVVAANAAAGALADEDPELLVGLPLDVVVLGDGGGGRSLTFEELPDDGSEVIARLNSGRFGSSVACTVARDIDDGVHLVGLQPVERSDGDVRAGLLAAAVDSSHDAIFTLQTDGTITAVSARAAEAAGHEPRWLHGRNIIQLLAEGRRPEFSRLLDAAASGHDVFQHDTQVVHRDGHVLEVTFNMAPLRMHRRGEMVGVSVIVQDITARKVLERRLRDHAERDPLTDVFNRRRLERELYRAVRLAQRHPDHAAALLLFDLDDFKRVNDTLGHAAGDDVLKTLTGAVAQCLRDTDVLARLGGDEFAIVVGDLDAPAAQVVAAKVLAAARTCLAPWGVTVSIGVTHFTGKKDETAQQILAATDRALYRAKAAGGDAVSGA